ncbi:Rhodanese-like domain-containing protein [Phellopilus nigrolimitatus]|nr:Rhodanese-like domain-containing protein [Phellopilus nigrolimitatus]
MSFRLVQRPSRYLPRAIFSKTAFLHRSIDGNRRHQYSTTTTMSFLPPFRYMTGEELVTLIKSDAKPYTDYVVFDVRDDDRVGGHILGSVHAPSNTFLERVRDLVEQTKDVPTVVFHCALSQARGPKAARIYSDLRSELEEKEGKEEKAHAVFVLRGGFTEFQLRHRNDPKLIESWDKDVWSSPYH